MKRMAYQCTYPTILAVLVLTLFAASAFASARPSHLDHVEARIKELHAKLKITQESNDDQINADNIVQQPRHDQNENTGDKGHQWAKTQGDIHSGSLFYTWTTFSTFFACVHE